MARGHGSEVSPQQAMLSFAKLCKTQGITDVVSEAVLPAVLKVSRGEDVSTGVSYVS